MQSKWQLINLFLTTYANTLSISLNNVTSIKGHILGLKLEVATKVIVNLLNHTSPLWVTSICLALMHQDTLNYAILLSLLSQSYQTLIWVVVISCKHTLHPVRSLGLYIVINAVGQESLDIDTTDSDVNYTNLNIFGQRSYEGTTEPVGRSKTSVRTAQRSRSLAPLTHLSALFWEVYSWHKQEAWARACQILSLRTGISLHI